MRRGWRTTLGAIIAAVLVAAGMWTLTGAGASASPPGPSGAAQEVAATTDRLLAGQRLASGQQLVSANGSYRLAMQTDGNVVLYGPSGARWASRTSVPGTILTLQNDGNLVAYAPDGRAVWNTRTGGSGADHAVVQDDGNFVLYRADGTAVWATNTAVPQVTDTLRVGQHLASGQSLVSANRSYRFSMQTDGNVVLTGPRGVLWASYTFVAGTSLSLQSDGNLVAYTPTGRAVWSTRTGGSGAVRAIVQSDGNVVLYRADGRAVWSTGTGGGIAVCPAAGYGINHYAPGSGLTVALTFDDGPGASTAAIEAILEQNGVHATFFNEGINSTVRPSTVQDEARHGFLLGNHTWSHAELTTLPASGQAAEMDRATTEQISLTGIRPCFFRPPYGEYDSTTLSLAQARSMKVYTWSVDTEDWKAEGSGSQYWIDRIIALGKAGLAQDHPVILMHNQSISMPATVAALPTIIATYRARGYRFVDLAGH